MKSRKRSLHNPFNMDLRPFKPLTKAQDQAQEAYDNDKHLLLCGYAGTGKTYLACVFAMNEILNGTKQRIHIFRSAVPSRDIGFLPGTEAEKMQVYEKAYASLFSEIFSRDDAWEILRAKRTVTFDSTSFLRGTTFNDCVLIVDEIQNLSDQEINTIMTRVGSNCRVILCGDQRQADLAKAQSGYRLLVKAAPYMANLLEVVEFGIDDIVRSGFVKSWIVAIESVKEQERVL